VLAKGKITPHPTRDANKKEVNLGNYTASLGKKNSRSAYVVTGFTRKVE
jgi:hypothetical protein